MNDRDIGRGSGSPKFVECPRCECCGQYQEETSKLSDVYVCRNKDCELFVPEEKEDE